MGRTKASLKHISNLLAGNVGKKRIIFLHRGADGAGVGGDGGEQALNLVEQGARSQKTTEKLSYLAKATDAFPMIEVP